MPVTVTGHHPQDVIDLVRTRASTGRRDDGAKLAVVVEGGAMRGVYTSGALLALHAMGLAAGFDDAYGTSAGAVNVAHFLSGMGEAKVDTYYRALVDGRFLDVRRLRKVVDIDFFVDQVLTHIRPVEVERIMQSPTRLWVAVGDYATGRSLTFNAHTCGLPLLQLLKAATAMPVLYNKLVPLGDVRGFDAGSFNPFPLEEAIAGGATHVLVLLAKPETYRSRTAKWWARGLIRYRFVRGNRAVRPLFADTAGACNRLRDMAHGRSPLPAPRVAVATIAPSHWEVGQGTRDVDVLRDATIRTARSVLEAFGHPHERITAWADSGVI